MREQEMPVGGGWEPEVPCAVCWRGREQGVPCVV